MTTFYGVWIGKKPGVYDNWPDCQSQVNKFPNAKYSKLKANTKELALIEFNLDKEPEIKIKKEEISSKLNQPIEETLTVDGASNGKNCEFQAVWYPSNKKLFSSKVYDGGTNNIAEFLGLVFAIKYLIDNNLPLRIYTDSVTAMAWLKKRKANTTARETGKITVELDNILLKAESYLEDNKEIFSKVSILKWETQMWGEIPADYGRK